MMRIARVSRRELFRGLVLVALASNWHACTSLRPRYDGGGAGSDASTIDSEVGAIDVATDRMGDSAGIDVATDRMGDTSGVDVPGIDAAVDGDTAIDTAGNADDVTLADSRDVAIAEDEGGEACVPNDSVVACGSSCTPCPAAPANGTAACIGGTCDFVCNAGFHRCGTHCAPDDSVTECGAMCVPCVPPANATATCDGMACDFVCDTGFVRVGMACALRTCGDMQLDAGEACDDGNIADGDGCSGSCVVESNTFVETCNLTSSVFIPIATSGRRIFSGSTVGTGNELTNCMAAGGDLALHFRVSSTAGTMLIMTYTAVGFDAVLRYNATFYGMCPPAATICADGSVATAPETATVTIPAGTTNATFYVILDGFLVNESGPFTFSIEAR